MKIFAALLAVIILALAPLTSHAAPPAPAIAVIDIQKILRDSTASQSIRKQLEAKRNSYQADIKKDEDRLRANDQAFGKERGTLSKDALIEKEKSLRQDFVGVERKVMSRRQVLDRSYAMAMKQVRDALAKIVIDTAKAQNVNLVLPKQETMWVAPELEITDSILTQLNSTLPNVTVSFTAPQEQKQDPKK